MKNFLICFQKKNYSEAEGHFGQFSGDLYRVSKSEVDFFVDGLKVLSCFPGESTINQCKKTNYVQNMQY